MSSSSSSSGPDTSLSSTTSTHIDTSSSVISSSSSSVMSSSTEITSSSTELSSEAVLTSMNDSTSFIESSTPPSIEETTLTSSSLSPTSSSIYTHDTTSVVATLTTVVSETHTENVTITSLTQYLDFNSSTPAVSTSPSTTWDLSSSFSPFISLAASPPNSSTSDRSVSVVTSFSSSVFNESGSLTESAPPLTTFESSFSSLIPNEENITSTITKNIQVTQYLSESTGTSVFVTEPTVSTFEGRGSLLTASLSVLMLALLF
ncbi:uncharacterized protein CYBJADRAFT_167294 [Cyberlindnera jadinii NRRL Y-1542]|nr:hypothetical protein CYBJADRAFT_167294 [Cyberlindnera jadinii NRRL Y-1542]ODV73880.1 hypothetical protein CYBJADRAFT_167294 [Cyberlindnera jadinii NRRL Y-1542]